MKFNNTCRRRFMLESRTRTPAPEYRSTREMKRGGLKTRPESETPDAEIRIRLKARTSASRAKVTLPRVPWGDEK